MIIPYEKYSTASFPFPEDNINPKDKDKAWAKKIGEAMFSLYLKDKTCVPYSEIEQIKELRGLANGDQDIGRYMKLLLDPSEESDTQEGYMNIDMDVFSVMPKFMRVMEGMFEQTEHQIIATAVDPKSSKEKEEMKLRTAFNMQFKDMLGEIEAGLGLEPNRTFIPESLEELELYSGMGGFKLSRETEIEEALDYTFYLSDWKNLIRSKIRRDLITLNRACVKDYTDNFTGKVRMRYVDPEFFIGEKSNSYDHRKMRLGGEIIQVDILEIIKQDENVDQKELSDLIKWYNGVNGNANLNDASIIIPENNKNDMSRYSNFKVDVLDFEYKTVNSEYWTSRNTHNEDLLYKEEWGKVHNTDKRKTKVYNIHAVYKGKWVIGTNIVYDFGLQHDVPRPGGKDVNLSYHYFSRPEKSIVHSSAPCLHQIALAHLKLQNAMAQAAPAGISIEYTSLQNMKLGGNKMEPLEILKIRKQTGDLLYKATTHKGQMNIPGGYRPIQELSGGIGAQLNEFVVVFNTYMNFIREVTGVNQVADASNPNPEQSVGGSELALAATNNALRPIYTGYISIKERVAMNACMRIQLLIKHNKKAYEGYVPVLGQVGVRIISTGADVVDSTYYIKFEAKPTQERKQVIRQAAIAAMNPDKDGVKGLELPDFLLIERILENGNLKYAEAFLNYKIQKNKERQLQLQRENMLLDKQRELEGIQMKHKAELEKTTHETSEKIRFEAAKLELEEKYKIAAHERKMKEIALQATMGAIEKSTVGQSNGITQST